MVSNYSSGSQILIAAQQQPSLDCFYLEVYNYSSDFIGTYHSLPHLFATIEPGFRIIDGSFACLTIPHNNNEIVLNVNSFGDVDEYIDINFSGNYEDEQGNPHTINGTIHVLRDE